MSVVHVIHFIYKSDHLRGGENQRSGGNDEFGRRLVNPLNENYLQGVTRAAVNEKELPVRGASPNAVVTSRHKPCDAAIKKPNN